MQGRFRLGLQIIACVVLWTLVGWGIGALATVPTVGLVLGLVFGLLFVVFGWYASERFALDLYDAEMLDSGQAPRLYEMVEELSEQAGIEPPLVYALGSPAPNAFALVRRQGNNVIGVTNGLTQHLEREEVRAVMALMVARIAGGQAAVWTVATTLAGIPLSWARGAGINDTLGDVLKIDPNAGMTVVGKAVLSLLIPPCAFGLNLAFDADGVARADRAAARMLENPDTLRRALMKIQAALPLRDGRVAGFYPSTALLFAVPPLPPASQGSAAGAPFWVRAQRWFPYQRPAAADRAEIVSAAR